MSSQKTPETPAAPKPINYKRVDGFTRSYANNVYLESTAWDLKLTFGEVDLSAGENVVVQHTSITIPWPQVKVLSYLLQVHLIGHEADHGRVTVPKGVISAIPSQMPKELEKLQVSPENYAVARRLYETFIAANPEAAPTQK